MRMMTFVLLLCMEQAMYASVISDTAEKEAICDRIRQVQSEMRSVIVKTELVREYGEGPERQSEEWGYSGEKLFLKRQWPSKVEEPASDRFQIGIWDGKHYKLYDTHTQSGSVRSSYDLQSSEVCLSSLRASTPDSLEPFQRGLSLSCWTVCRRRLGSLNETSPTRRSAFPSIGEALSIDGGLIQARITW